MPVRIGYLVASLVGLWLLVGCPVDDDDAVTVDDDTSGDDDGTGDDDTTETSDPCEHAAPDDPCCNERGPWISLGFDELEWPGEIPVTGEFVDWGHWSGVQFEADDGAVYDAWLDGVSEIWSLVPDLGASGQVTVVMWGGCDGKSGCHNAVYVMAGQDLDRPLLIVGNIGVTDFFGWTVESPRDIETCPGRPSDGCYEFQHNRPVTIRHDAESVQLYQGQDAQLGNADVYLGAAISGSGEEYCVDGGGPDWAAWFVVPQPDPEV